MFRERDYPIAIPTWEKGEWVEDTIFNTEHDLLHKQQKAHVSIWNM